MAKKKNITVLGDRSTPPPLGDGPPIIMGHEAQIDEIAKLQSQIDQAHRRIQEIRAELDPIADAERCRIETATGRPCKLIQVKGSTVNGRYTFQDRYSEIHLDSLPALRELLGAHFEALFRETETIQLKHDSKPRLWALLGELKRTDEFLSIDPCITPVDDFREVRASLRGTLSTIANEKLDDVVRQVAARPSLSVK